MCVGRGFPAHKSIISTLSTKKEVNVIFIYTMKQNLDALEKERKKKREWKRKQRLKQLKALKDKFKSEYGEIETALSQLSSREKKVIILVYGLQGYPMKQKDIAAQWSVTPRWISDIKKTALNKLEEARKSGRLKY